MYEYRVHTLYQVAKSDGRDRAGSRLDFFSAAAVAAGRRRVAKLAVQRDPQGVRHIYICGVSAVLPRNSKCTIFFLETAINMVSPFMTVTSCSSRYLMK